MKGEFDKTIILNHSEQGKIFWVGACPSIAFPALYNYCIENWLSNFFLISLWHPTKPTSTSHPHFFIQNIAGWTYPKTKDIFCDKKPKIPISVLKSQQIR